MWSWSGRSFFSFFFFFGLSPCPLTLHIYADGLDGSHPHPVVGFAVVATPLHPLDALDAQRLVVDRCFLELVWCTACRLCPPYLRRARERGENVELRNRLSVKARCTEGQNQSKRNGKQLRQQQRRRKATKPPWRLMFTKCLSLKIQWAKKCRKVSTLTSLCPNKASFSCTLRIIRPKNTTCNSDPLVPYPNKVKWVTGSSLKDNLKPWLGETTG